MASGTGCILESVQSQEFLDVLRALLEMFLSSMGPKAGIKMLVSGGGVTTTTSVSSRLLNSTVISHPLCLFISQVMKAQITTYGDFGLYTGALTSSLLEKVLKQDLMVQSKACHYLQTLFPKVLSLLDSEAIKVELEFSSVKQLLIIAKTILSSKPACGLSSKDIDYLCLQIVKVFLNTVDDDFGDVIIVNSGSSNDVNVVMNGLLYQIDNEENYVRGLLAEMVTEKKEITVVLFNIMLTDSEVKRRDEEDIVLEKEKDILKDATVLFEQLDEINVKIVACQKVVHNSLRLLLQRKGILLLDRLGTELSRALEKLSGAKAISSLQRMSKECLLSHLGSLDCARLMNFGSRHFVLLERNGANVATLLLHGVSQEAHTELTAVTQQVLAALRLVVCRPLVVPGAGCLEMWLAVQLGVQVGMGKETEESGQQEAAMSWLQGALLRVAGVFGATARFRTADSVYCHGWTDWDPAQMKSCCCGLVQTHEVQRAGGRWVQLDCFALNKPVFEKSAGFHPQPKAPSGVHEDALVDVYVSKCNALKLALETCVQILNIGLVVKRKAD